MLDNILLSCNIRPIFLYLNLFTQVQSPGNNITLGWELGAWPGYSLYYLTCFTLVLSLLHPFTCRPAFKPGLHPYSPKHYALNLTFLYSCFLPSMPPTAARPFPVPPSPGSLPRPAPPHPASLERWPGHSTESRPQFPGEHFLLLYTKILLVSTLMLV